MGFIGSVSSLQGCFLLKAIGENPFPPASRDGLHFLACGHITLTSASVLICPSLLL